MQLAFEPARPAAHACPVDGAIFTGPRFDAAWRFSANALLSQSALNLALAWRLAGEEAHRTACAEILLGYAARYAGYAAVSKTVANSGVATYTTLDESTWIIPLPLLLPTRMYFGFSKPRVNILGSEFAGEIEAVGSSVTRFKAGDQVMGYLGQRMGAYAEYVCMAESGSLALKPANMSYAEAATVPYGALMATSLLRRVDLRPGAKVLINGASGGIGSAAVQLAKHHGAEVTGICGAPRMEYVRALGADHGIDYAREDFTRNGRRYDLIFDVLGRSSFARCRNSLTPNGVYLLASFKTKALLQMLRSKVAGSQKVVCALASERPEDLVVVRKLAEADAYKTIVSRSFPLEQAAEAHRYVESGSRTGPVVLIVR